jgi:hypothetical protein
MDRLETRGIPTGGGLSNATSYADWGCPWTGESQSANTWYMEEVENIGGTKGGAWYSSTLSYEGPLTTLDALATTIPNGNNNAGCASPDSNFNWASNFGGSYFGVQGYSDVTYLNGLLVRTYPPNGVMPTFSLGTLH